MKRIYLDYAATTPVDPEVLRAMEPYYSGRFGNPGSLHSFGQEAIAAVDRSREEIAKAVGADFRQLVFTGSATEANNLAVRGVMLGAQQSALRPSGARVLISAIEHESILEAVREAERAGIEVVCIPVDRRGIVEVAKIKKNLNARTVLVSIMYANNELGSIQPIAEIAKIIAEFRGNDKYPLFHADAAQAFQFLDCDVNALGVDLMTLSAHKVYGPKGAGALYVRDIKDLRAIINGGGQEFGLRSGTENVPAIIGFAKAAELALAARKKVSKRLAELRDHLWAEIKKTFSKAEINGPESGLEKLPNILNVYFPGHSAQDLLTKFDLAGLAVSSGSACRSRAVESSYVIEALGYSKERAKSSIRFSLGRPTTRGEIENAINLVRTFGPGS